MRHLVGRLLAFFNLRRLDSDSDQELESHLAMLADDYVRRGMTPEQAHRTALLKLGAVRNFARPIARFEVCCFSPD
jgi:hypothetical protein